MHDWESTILEGSVWETTCITEANSNINSDVIKFGKLAEAVKINQIPGMHQIGRKDNLYLVIFRGFNLLHSSFSVFILEEFSSDVETVGTKFMG